MVKDHRAPRVKEVGLGESDLPGCRRSDRRARGSRNIDPIMGRPRRTVVDPLATVDAADTPRDRPDKSVAHCTKAVISRQSLRFGDADFGALGSNTFQVLLIWGNRLLGHTGDFLQPILPDRHCHLLHTGIVGGDR